MTVSERAKAMKSRRGGGPLMLVTCDVVSTPVGDR